MNAFHVLTAIAALLAVAALPARAQEGQGNPFPNAAQGTTTTQVQFADLSSEAYPDIVGRPGYVLSVATDWTLAGLGNEVPVQTANSLPPGFDVGTAAYAYEQSVNQHLAAQNDPAQDTYPTVALAELPQD